MSLPHDPVMLLSIINTRLRDRYDSLEDLAASENISAEDLIEQLARINYTYDPVTNRFV